MSGPFLRKLSDDEKILLICVGNEIFLSQGIFN